MGQVYIFCYPDDQYISCVLVAYYFVFIQIIRGKVIQYLYYDLSIFLLLVNSIGVPKGANISIFLFRKKNIRNNFVWYCT